MVIRLGQGEISVEAGSSTKNVIMYQPPTDDIHSYALSKTLTKVSSPATVGLYSSCRERIDMMLKQIQVYTKMETSRIEQEYKGGTKPRSQQASLGGFLALIGRMFFYRPIWTKENRHHHNIRFIFVHFSAWHFAGSDLLWAGLAIRLFQAMQMNFGKLHLVLYRVAQHEEEDEVRQKVLEESTNDWRSKKVCCCPLWLLVICLLVLPLILIVIPWTTIQSEPNVEQEQAKNATGSQENVDGVLNGLIIASFGVPAATVLRFLFLMGKNFIFSQEQNIKKGMDNEQISMKMGFMNEVRKEMWFLAQFLQFMEVFERRRIRVVLQITNLDRCQPKKIVAVLDAMNILLSENESPFISILAVNPDVLVQKVNFADGCLSKEDRAHALLNRIVTLAFTVPPLCDDSKRRLFLSLISASQTPKDTSETDSEHRPGEVKKSSFSDVPSVEITFEGDEIIPLHDKKVPNVMEEEVEELVKSILSSDERRMNKYLLEDGMLMRRVINSVRVTVTIMKALKKELPPPEDITAWVVLVNQWPCRLSWIIQCVEDAQQRADIDNENNPFDDSKTLWEVFSESKAELYVMRAQIEDLLNEDRDPEMFEKLLKVDFPFTVQDMKTFEVATVNLDHTIRKELARIRGTSRLKDTGWMRNLAPLPITTIINMETEDVCKELELMKFPRKYIDIVKNNDLSGSALVFGDVDDLKDLLDMTFGEWATFRLHFLGLPPHLQPQHRNTLPPKNYLSRMALCATYQYSSNPSLLDFCK